MLRIGILNLIAVDGRKWAFHSLTAAAFHKNFDHDLGPNTFQRHNSKKWAKIFNVLRKKGPKREGAHRVIARWARLASPPPCERKVIYFSWAVLWAIWVTNQTIWHGTQRGAITRHNYETRKRMSTESKEKLERLWARRRGHRGACTKLEKQAIELIARAQNDDFERYKNLNDSKTTRGKIEIIERNWRRNPKYMRGSGYKTWNRRVSGNFRQDLRSRANNWKRNESNRREFQM